MAVSTKMTVDVSGFVQGMREAQAGARTLDQELKRNEAQFKATGDKEQYLADKSRILQMQIKQQKAIAVQAEAALKSMAENGVAKTSVEYQKMQLQLSAAQTAMNNYGAELNSVAVGEQAAAKGASELTQSVQGISKKISLDQVISGIGSITSAMEKAAGKAVELGKTIWENVMDSAKWADDSATMALMYGIDLDTYLRVEKLVQNGMDTTVEAILKSQSKLKKNVGSSSKEAMDALREMGLLKQEAGKYSEEAIESPITEDSVELFWQAGQALMQLGDEYEQEAKAQALFGKSWRELIPLFKNYKNAEEFNEALAGVNVNTEEEVSALAELNDKVGELEGNFETLKTKFLAEMAPALTSVSETLSGLLENLIHYLETPEGAKMLEDMGTAVSGLFEDLGKIDPEQVVSGFKAVFDQIISGVQWIVRNKENVINALKGIVAGWGALKLTGGVLQIIKLVNGLNTLRDKGMPEISSLTPSAANGGIPAGSAAGAGAGTEAGTGNAAQDIAASGTGVMTGKGVQGNAFERILNKATLVAAAAAAGEAFNPKNAEGWKGVEEILNSGLSQEEQKLQVMMHDFQMTEAEAAEILNGSVSVGDKTEEKLEKAKDVLEECKEVTKDLEQTKDARSILETIFGIGGSTGGGGGDSGGHGFGIAEPKYNIEQAEKAWEEAHRKLEEEYGLVRMDIEVEEISEEEADAFVAAAKKEIGTIEVPVQLVFGGGSTSGGGGLTYLFDQHSGLLGKYHANGLWNVPWDGYPAILHRGERVLTARENRQYTYNSNNYFGNVNLNNGLEIEALTESIDRRNRRQRSGYGAN